MPGLSGRGRPGASESSGDRPRAVDLDGGGVSFVSPENDENRSSVHHGTYFPYEVLSSLPEVSSININIKDPDQMSSTRVADGGADPRGPGPIQDCRSLQEVSNKRISNTL